MCGRASSQVRLGLGCLFRKHTDINLMSVTGSRHNVSKSTADRRCSSNQYNCKQKWQCNRHRVNGVFKKRCQHQVLYAHYSGVPLHVQATFPGTWRRKNFTKAQINQLWHNTVYPPLHFNILSVVIWRLSRFTEWYFWCSCRDCT
jgi:hypothetical protein